MNLNETAINNMTVSNNASTQTIHSTTEVVGISDDDNSSFNDLRPVNENTDCYSEDEETKILLGSPTNELSDDRNENNELNRSSGYVSTIFRGTVSFESLPDTLSLVGISDDDISVDNSSFNVLRPVNENADCYSEDKETIILLGSPTNELSDDRNENNDISNKSLDWNKVLRYLAGEIHADQWQMFFDCLYENTKLSKEFNYQERIRRVALDWKNNGTETLLLEQFKSWKQAAGNNASPDVIETTLTDLTHNDTLQKFRNYMRDPPYLDSTDISVHVDADDERHQSNDLFAANNQSSTRYELGPLGKKLVKETYSKKYLEYTRISPNTAGERFQPDGSSLFNFDMTHDAGLQVVQDRSILTSPDKSLKALTAIDKSDGLVSNECQVYQYTGVSSSESMPKRRTKYRHKCLRKRKPRATKRLSPKSIELSIESYVQTEQEIKSDMHGFSTRQTIDELLKSNIKRDSALRLKYKEYCDIETINTKRGDTVHILYIGEEMRMLGPNTYNKLKLYAEHVRAKAVQRLKNMDEDDYMFIDFNGSPLLKKHEDSSDDTTSTSSSEGSETCPEMVNGTCEDQN